MPTGVYKRTEEYRKKLKGNHNSPRTEFKKGHIPWNKGKKGVMPTNCWKGKELSVEHKKKISLAKKGKSYQEIGRTPMSEITKRKIGESHKGEKSVNWKGGITPINKKVWRSLKMKLWRKSVFSRDNYTCRKCKQLGGRLQPHHIFNFAEHSELRTKIDNGVTLCDICHRKFHKIYGRKNNNKKQLEEFLTNKL